MSHANLRLLANQARRYSGGRVEMTADFAEGIAGKWSHVGGVVSRAGGTVVEEAGAAETAAVACVTLGV